MNFLFGGVAEWLLRNGEGYVGIAGDVQVKRLSLVGSGSTERSDNN